PRAGKRIEGLAGSGETGGGARVGLPTTNNDVDVERIELKPMAATSKPLTSDQRRAAAEERVEHDVAATGHIEDGVRDHSDRLHSRMQGREPPFLSRPSETRSRGVGPHVAAMPPVDAELDVVAIAACPQLEHEN